MNPALLDQIVSAVLYEGYILYPYRASSGKNQRERFTFGRVYPRAYSDAQSGAEPARMQTECLLKARSASASLDVTVRFLQPMWRDVGLLKKALDEWPADGEPECLVVPEVLMNGVTHQTWQEAVEREVKLPSISFTATGARQVTFRFEASRSVEPIRDEQDRIQAMFIRRTEVIQGVVEVGATVMADGIFKVTICITNESKIAGADLSNQDAVITRTLASTHTVLRADGAEFISLMDPPVEFKQEAARCKNIGAWPVLVGDEAQGERDVMLSSPIILYDYPKIAPESRGDLFDGTEIDEILTLRIMTMTDEEKREMRNVDAHARRLLERTEALPKDDLLKMHGTLRELRSFDEQLFGSNIPLESISLNDASVTRGTRVRIRPKHRADVMDIALAGRIALVEAVEQDAEQQVHLALVLEDDPGKDLGMLRQTGHRFFYRLDEVELLLEGEAV